MQFFVRRKTANLIIIVKHFSMPIFSKSLELMLLSSYRRRLSQNLRILLYYSMLTSVYVPAVVVLVLYRFVLLLVVTNEFRKVLKQH